jgi:hypothetical protein
MKRTLLMLMLALARLGAQEKPDDVVQRLVRLKYADPLSVSSLLRNFGVALTPDQKMMVLAISGKRSAVETAEAAVKQLDVPGAAQKDIELTVYFVVGSDLPAGPNDVLVPVPSEIQSTVAALKTTFPYKSYSMLDTLSLRARAGSSAETSGRIGGDRVTNFQVRSASLEADGEMIRIERLHAVLRVLHTISGRQEYVDTGITTEVVDVKAGQKLVVGRASLEGPGKALFLVLIARVAQ